MHVLFVHQNFPAQFRFIAPRLIQEFGWQCSFCTERVDGELPGVRKILYKARGGASTANSVLTRNYENAVAHSHGVFDALKEQKDLKPDLVVAHSGFGSSLFLPFLYDAPVINFLEFFYHPVGQDLGFRPEIPVGEMELLRSKTNNSMILLDVVNCDRGWTATHYQRAFFPIELQSKIEAIFDGIDTSVYHRKDGARQRICEAYKIDPAHHIISYVARGFEMMRGFDIFMKAAKRICETRTDITFVVVGTDKVHYGGDLKYIKEASLRHHILSEGGYDLTRFRFTGYLPQETLADVLSAADVHIYLTEPFIASWSMVNAMACGAILIASDQTCVREYVQDGQNGILTNFFDDEALANKAMSVLDQKASYDGMRHAAMQTVREKFSLDVAIPRIKDFFERIGSKPRAVSVRLEKLMRAGTIAKVTDDPEVLARKARLTDAPTPGSANASVTTPQSPLQQAITQVRQMGSVGRTVSDWVKVAHNYKGPRPYEVLGPRNHPSDLVRLLQRLAEWKAATLVEIGAYEGGTTFLFAQMAVPEAKIISVSSLAQPIDPDRAEFLQAMARMRQSVVCIATGKDEQNRIEQIEGALEKRQIDFLFLQGRRPYSEVVFDYRRLRKRLRAGGLIAWDGVQPVIPFSAEQDGGQRLWAEVQSLYPQKAEYFNGTSTEFGGIVMVKV